MKSGKSTGLGRLPIEYLKAPVDERLWESVAVAFNYFVECGYPAELNHMLMMPLFKKGDVAKCGNYRGISLMHPLGRLFSKVVVARLEGDGRAVRARGQAGFRAGHRVEDNSVILQAALEHSRRLSLPLFCVFVDLAKAYDSVPRR